jgi:hypothetical protein
VCPDGRWSPHEGYSDCTAVDSCAAEGQLICETVDYIEPDSDDGVGVEMVHGVPPLLLREKLSKNCAQSVPIRMKRLAIRSNSRQLRYRY